MQTPNATYGITPDPLTPTSPAWYNSSNQIASGIPDLDGNQQRFNPFALIYDAENRLTTVNMTVNGSTSTVATYRYDADGHRVVKTAPSGQTIYVYGATSAVLFTNSSGGVERRYDYKAFGEGLLAGTNGRASPDYMSPSSAMTPDVMGHKFTGQLRDAETGMDFFGARYFSGAQGRFASPDEPFADQNFSYPQSWNLYAYGRNNPLRFSDLDGRKCVQTSNGQADDGTGGGCEAGGVDATGKITPQQVNVQDFEPPSPLLLAVAQGAQRAGPTVNALGIATGAVLTGGAVGAGIGAIGGGTGLISLSIGATRAATLTPLLLPAGDKLAQIIRRLGEGQQNPQLVLQKLGELRDAAVAAGTAVQGFYIQSGVTIYRVGENYLGVSGQGKILSYVEGATPGTGVVQRYLELGGK